MTMPHLMNCPHLTDGWCLDCVGQLHDYTDALNARCVADTPDAERWRKLRDTPATSVAPGPLRGWLFSRPGGADSLDRMADALAAHWQRRSAGRAPGKVPSIGWLGVTVRHKEKQLELRKVIVSKPVRQELPINVAGRVTVAYPLVPQGEALFHQFGVSYEVFEAGPGNYTTAIIEWPDGRVESVPAEHVRFVTPNV